MRFNQTPLAAIALFATVFIGGCASTDSALFVTKTSLGVELDSKPANVNIGYDRIEGYVGPRYDNGAIPPVVASINSDAAIFNPKVRQIYATGEAAYNVVTKGPLRADAKPLSGGKKLMFFGTTTTTGFKVGFTSNIPDSVMFGFKRKEFSYIPLATQNGVDIYPSVLASIDTAATADAPEQTALVTKQFFATGSAAEVLGTNPDVRQDFATEAKNAFAAYRDEVHAQDEQAVVALTCFTYVSDDKLLAIWADAQRHSLFQTTGLYDELQREYATAVARPAGDSTRVGLIREMRGLYASDIGNSQGTRPTRATLMRAHGEFVCEQARS